MKMIGAFHTNLRTRHLFLIDTAIVFSTPFLAFLVRLESLSAVLLCLPSLLVFTFSSALMKLLLFYRAGLFRQYWPSAGEKELKSLFQATATSFASELVLFFVILSPLDIFPNPMPRSVPVVDGLLTMLLIGGVRLSVRLNFVFARRGNLVSPPSHVLIAGAGIAGVMVAKQLAEDKASGLVPVGFIDDDPYKIGMTVHGFPVLGKITELREILKSKEREIVQVIIAMPSASGKVVREIVDTCKDCHVDSKTVPGLLEILRGTAKVDQFRNINLEDLLRRGAVQTDSRSVSSLLQGKRVMVTGAGGSIGAEICRQVKDFKPSEIILVGHGENSIFAVARELRARPSTETISPVIADIRDWHRMQCVFSKHMPEIVFHAAAHKHVGLMQDNVADAITNNVLGTRNLLELCDCHGVQRFVMISSDKAVNPTSIMGVTKRVAELIVNKAARGGTRRYVTVRFGNVLGSRGSVVPIFQRQIEQGGPVTVTHPDVRRYFMTIPEAVQLVLQAGTMGEGKELFVLDMGEQIRVADLARDMIRLCGPGEGNDIEIVYTRMAPGEKMCEDLFYGEEKFEKTSNDKILVCRDGCPVSTGTNRESDLDDQVHALLEAADRGSESEMIALLKRIVPQYCAPEEKERMPDSLDVRSALLMRREGAAALAGALGQAAGGRDIAIASTSPRGTGRGEAGLRIAQSGVGESKKRIYLSPPHLDGRERELLCETLESNWISTVGPQVDAFEREMSTYLGEGYAVALSSGTAALHLALLNAGVRAGDEVLCSTLTFAASANAIVYAGAQPVFIDSERSSWNMDPVLLEEELGACAARGKRPAAVVVVDMYGQCANYARIIEICGRYGVPVIEDAAEALGSSFGGRKAGMFGLMGILSFNGNKIITTSGGGMLLSTSRELVERARFLSTQARDPAPYYQHSVIGYNYRMSNLLAAVGRAQLERLDAKIARRRVINLMYRTVLMGQSGIEFMPEVPFGVSNSWLTPILVDKDLLGVSTEAIRQHLERQDIESRPLWKPMHLQPVFRHCRVRGGSVAEDLFQRGLCLPSGTGMTTEDLVRVLQALLETFKLQEKGSLINRERLERILDRPQVPWRLPDLVSRG